MNYCPKCGAYIPDGETKCLACGFDTAEKKTEDAGREHDFGGAASQSAPKYEEKTGKTTEEQSYAGTVIDDEPRAENRRQYGGTIFDDAVDNRGMAVLCYMGPLFIIPLLTRRGSAFVRYHANQGLVLFLVELMVDFCGALPAIGGIAAAAGAVLVLLGFISGISNALGGRMRPMPVFGGINILK